MEINRIGRVLRANTRMFVFGCKVPRSEVPIFGSFVKTKIQYKDATVFGLICNIEIQDDGMTKLLSVSEEATDEDIEWQRQRRVPVEASVLCVGFQENTGEIRQTLSAQPPITLDDVFNCDDDEVMQFTRKLDFFRLVLDARDTPCDELLAASIRLSRDVRVVSQRETFIRDCGRELARLLSNDGARLESVLRRMA